MSQREVPYIPGLKPGSRQPGDRPRSKSPHSRRSDSSASGSRERDSRTPARRGLGPSSLDGDYIPLPLSPNASFQTRQGPSSAAGAAPRSVDSGQRPDRGALRDQGPKQGARPTPVEYNGSFRPSRGGESLSAGRPSSEAVEQLLAEVSGRQTSARREPGAPNVPVMPAPTPTSEAIRRLPAGRDIVDSLPAELGRQTGRAPPTAPNIPVRLVQTAVQDVSPRRAPGAPNPPMRSSGTQIQDASPRRTPADVQDVSARRAPVLANVQAAPMRPAPADAVQDVPARQAQREEASCSRAEPRPPADTRDTSARRAPADTAEASARRITSNDFKDVPASRAIIAPPAPSTSGSRAPNTTEPSSAPPRPHASDSPRSPTSSSVGLKTIQGLESLHTWHLGHLKKLQAQSQGGQVRSYVRAFIESYDQNIQQFKEKLDRDKERAAKRRCSDAAEERCVEARKAIAEAEAKCREAEAKCREAEEARERARKDYQDSLSDGNSQ